MSSHSPRTAALTRPLSSVASLLALVVLSAAGCGDKAEAQRVPVFPVEGRITLKGQPMPGATVSFHPQDAARQCAAPARRN